MNKIDKIRESRDKEMQASIAELKAEVHRDILLDRIAELEAENKSLEERYSLAQEEIVRLKNDISLLAPAWTKEEDWSDE